MLAFETHMDIKDFILLFIFWKDPVHVKGPYFFLVKGPYFFLVKAPYNKLDFLNSVSCHHV